MTAGERALSLFFVAFVAVKAAEIAFELERWPLTYVPMFARRIPPEETFWRVTLHGTTGGPWVELPAGAFNLNEDELIRRLFVGLEKMGAACAELGRAYNASRPPDQQLRQLVALVTKVLRPGVPGEPDEVTVPCLPETLEGGG